MEKLIGMTDFVLEQGMNSLQNDTKCWTKTHKYAEFLKQPLTLGMFAPCDEYGNTLDCPHNYGLLSMYPTGDILMHASFKDALEYQEAKERVLFDGFHEHLYNVSNDKIEINLETLWFSDVQHNGVCYGQVKTVEDLIQFDLLLSKTAKNQLS